MQTKLTLRLDEELVRRAKAYAKREGKSLSQMVSDYFSLLKQPSGERPPGGKREAGPAAPLTQSLRGILRGAKVGEEDYRRYLDEKYG